jgi:phage shock protein PspC (stress-responsive transcriptional regulator)
VARWRTALPPAIVVTSEFRSKAMAMSDELERLGDLHRRGVLSDAEFERAKARVLDEAPRDGTEGAAVAAINGLRRSHDDCWIGGVCGGIAKSTGVATWVWRLMFAMLVLCAGSGLLLYLLLWILVPKDDTWVGGDLGQPRAG